MAISKISSDGLAAAGIAQSNMGTGVAGTGPAFSAYVGTTQSVTSDVNTKVACNTEEFDTASCYDNSLYRFTPNVAGYYQVSGMLSCRSATSVSRFNVQVWKNGSLFKWGGDINYGTGIGYKIGVSALVYMNGSTDYLELYASVTAGTAQVTGGDNASTYFQAFLARSA